MTTVGIIQPNFIPWRGYFDLIRRVDVFVFLDDVQYTERNWRNRNRIRTRAGPSRWLTVPVRAARTDLIRDVAIDGERDWQREHGNLLRENYRDAPYLADVLAMLEAAASRHRLIADLDIDLCLTVMDRLGIATPTLRSSALGATGVKDERLVTIVRRLGGTRYLSGPAAKAYICPAFWEAAGIALEFMSYPDYPPYRQIAEPYDPIVSIIDLLMMEGDRARDLLDPPAPPSPAPGTCRAGDPA